MGYERVGCNLPSMLYGKKTKKTWYKAKTPPLKAALHLYRMSHISIRLLQQCGREGTADMIYTLRRFDGRLSRTREPFTCKECKAATRMWHWNASPRRGRREVKLEGRLSLSSSIINRKCNWEGVDLNTRHSSSLIAVTRVTVIRASTRCWVMRHFTVWVDALVIKFSKVLLSPFLFKHSYPEYILHGRSFTAYCMSLSRRLLKFAAAKSPFRRGDHYNFIS